MYMTPRQESINITGHSSYKIDVEFLMPNCPGVSEKSSCEVWLKEAAKPFDDVTCAGKDRPAGTA